MAAKDHSSNYIDDESEETVSLCDLLVYSDDHTNHMTTMNPTSSQSNNIKEEDESSFEFFSQEWLKNNQDFNFSPNKDAIFGGNFLLPKKPISRNTKEFKKSDQGSKKTNLDSGSCRNREFAKLMSMNKGRSYGGKHEPKRGVPASASMKSSRWYFYGFGLAGIPTEMELSAIKSRQNRHRKSQSVCGRKEENAGFRDGKGLGRLIRELSCDGQTQANSMVKASLVYVPRV